MESLNVVVVSDGEDSSGTLVMENIAKYSRHNLSVIQWYPKGNLSDVDIIYVHYGGVIDWHQSKLKTLLETKRDVKWIGGIRGVTNLKKWATNWGPVTKFRDFVYLFDGISCANVTFMDFCRGVDVDLSIFLCHSGTFTGRFKPSPLPKQFTIGWAGDAYAGAKMFPDFIKLPFHKRTAGHNIGTARPYVEMPYFYPKISVYVSTSVEEGSPVPPKEAAASGRPVVAIAVGDLPEWVPSEWLVPNVVDGYKALIPLIERLRVDRELLEVESERFRGLSLRWDFKIISMEYDLMFESVMK